MVDIFKSAIDAAFGAGATARITNNFSSSSTSSSAGVKNDFTGQIVDVGNIRLRVGNQIAEGGYALVFIAYDLKTNKEYALKRLFAADDSAKKAIAQEIAFLQKLNGNQHVVPFIAAASTQDATLRRTEYLLVTDYCSGGRLYERVVHRSKPLEVEEVIQIYYQICLAVRHLHEQNPPIIHRDLKVENCLLTSTGFIQLCDFGSATTKIYLPDESWTVKKREFVEDEMTKVTTPMYRAPEMLDTYNNYPINEQVDIWALGCLLYYLCFINHPFEDSAKLRIINAKYTIPSTNQRYVVLHDLIRTLLQVDPRQRPTIKTLVENIEDLAIGNDIGLNEPLTFLFNPNESMNSSPPPPPPSSVGAAAAGGGGGGGMSSFLPSSIKGLNNTSKSWMKNFIDTSSKVLNEGVQQVKQTIATTIPTTNPTGSTHHHHQFEVDMSYITSKLIVMSTPRDNPSDLTGRQSAELIRDTLDTKHPQSYFLFSLSTNSHYRKELFHNRVVDLPISDEKHSPRLIDLLVFCQKVSSFLIESPSNVAVLHCSDGRNQVAFAACALIAYHGIFPQVDHLIRFYESKRCAHPALTMSQRRYVQYLCDLATGMIERPHFTEFIIRSVNLSPVPLFNRERTGCRPFVDIFTPDQKKIFSTHQDPSKLRVFSAIDGVCLIPINIPFNGDLTIHINHAPVGLSLSAHDGGIRICQLTINSNFASTNQSELSYSRYELDGIEQTEKYPPSFRVTLETSLSKKPPSNEQEFLNQQIQQTFQRPQTLFKDENDFRQTIDEYGDSHQFQRVQTTNVPVESSSSLPAPPSPQVERRASPQVELENPIVVGTLLDIMGDETTSIEQIKPTIVEKQEENLFDFDSNEEKSVGNVVPQVNHHDLLGVDFGSMSLDKPILHRNASEIVFPQPIQTTTTMSMQSSILKPEQKSSSNQNIDRSDPFKDLFSSSTSKSSSKETLASQHAAAAAAKLNNPQPPSQNNFNFNLNNRPTNPTPPPQPAPPKVNPVPPPAAAPQPTSRPASAAAFDFADLLDPHRGSNQFGSAEQQKNLSIAEQGKVKLYKDLDPSVIKVREWTEGKKRNIRALLCSLNTVTWPECTWGGCHMHELVSHEQVKKVYRKAVLHIHPDKLRGDPNEELAKLIFVELNEAWSQFERENN